MLYMISNRWILGEAPGKSSQAGCENRVGKGSKLDCEDGIWGKECLVCFLFRICVRDTEEGNFQKVTWGHGWKSLYASLDFIL